MRADEEYSRLSYWVNDCRSFEDLPYPEILSDIAALLEDLQESKDLIDELVHG